MVFTAVRDISMWLVIDGLGRIPTLQKRVGWYKVHGSPGKWFTIGSDRICLGRVYLYVSGILKHGMARHGGSLRHSKRASSSERHRHSCIHHPSTEYALVTLGR